MKQILAGGDFRFFWPENIKNFIYFPSAWDSILNAGVGKPALESLWITSYFNLAVLFSKIGLSWNTIGILFFFLPAILISFFSAHYLFQKIFNKGRIFSFLSGLIYLANTYALLILGGGQMGVILGYSLAPLVFYFFIRLIDLKNFRQVLVFSTIFSLQILWDLRVAAVTFIGLSAYLFFKTLSGKKFIDKDLLKNLSTSFLIITALHCFWILPILLAGKSGLAHNQENFFNTEALKFLSFANFSNGFSLLHPNWPENIFGKIYFMRSEFLLIPILAYSSLLFINEKLKIKNEKRQIKIKNFKNNEAILFFALLALIGAFLAKGVNPPLGQVYLWLFENFPGFFMFRDPTKFYILLSLSYTILIPFTIAQFAGIIKKKTNKKSLFYFPVVLFLIYWIILLQPVLTENNNFIGLKSVPQEYVSFKNFILKDQNFYRTLWIPHLQRFGFFDQNHPAIDAFRFLDKNEEEAINWLKNDGVQVYLVRLGVKYIVVPYDSEGELFLEDRKYSEEKYKSTVSSLAEIPWLEKVIIADLGKIAVFKLSETPNSRFWLEDKNGNLIENGVIWLFENPSEYIVKTGYIKEPMNLIFSESYNDGWVLINNGNGARVKSLKTADGLNSFLINSQKDNEIVVYFEPQRHVNLGLVVSAATLIFVIIGLLGMVKVKN